MHRDVLVIVAMIVIVVMVMVRPVLGVPMRVGFLAAKKGCDLHGGTGWGDTITGFLFPS